MRTAALSLIVGLVLAGGQGALAQAPSAAPQMPTESDGDHGIDQSAPPGIDAAVTPRASATPDLERRTSEVAAGLRCPVCQGVSIEDSPTELARQMRATVRDQLAAGRSDDEVRQYFVDRYGEWVLLEPRASGFNMLVYVLPWLLVAAGIGVIVLMVRRWTRPLPAEAAAQASVPASTLTSRD